MKELRSQAARNVGKEGRETRRAGIWAKLGVCNRKGVTVDDGGQKTKGACLVFVGRNDTLSVG